MKNRILMREHGTEALLNAQGGAPGQERMAVYAEAYVARLAEALAETYETVRHLLGHDAFIELTESYLEAHPSHSYNLGSVGENMPEHLAQSRFLKKLPFLSDLARLERQVARTFHAFESASFDPAKLSGLSEDDWERLCVVFQPSLAVVTSTWPILDIWHARQTPLDKIHIDLVDRPQQVLVSRHGLEVVCELLDPLQAGLILALQKGEPLGASCARLAETAEAETLPMGEWFSAWTSRGLIAKVAS